MTEFSRRTVAKAGAWSAPLVMASTAVPTYAASSSTDDKKLNIQYGLFVSTQVGGGYVGYATSNGTAATRPDTPAEHFLASSNPESDINWDDASSSPTNGSFVNGEGSFTPVTQSATGSDGAYASVSGFWFSVPTTNALTGTDYVPGSTAVLAKGATFVTEVEMSVPAGAEWTVKNGKINGQTWSRQLTGKLNASSGNSATYLATATIPGTWTASAPTVTQQADGSYLLKATITYVTSADYTLTQSGNKYYAQTVIMPAQVSFSPAYGWNYYQQTSRVQSATVTYSGNGISDSLAINGLDTTSRINP